MSNFSKLYVKFRIFCDELDKFIINLVTIISLVLVIFIIFAMTFSNFQVEFMSLFCWSFSFHENPIFILNLLATFFMFIVVQFSYD